MLSDGASRGLDELARQVQADMMAAAVVAQGRASRRTDTPRNAAAVG